jgi:Phosphopantetheine attachment site
MRIDHSAPFTWSTVDALAQSHIVTGLDPTRVGPSAYGMRDSSMEFIQMAIQQAGYAPTTADPAATEQSLAVRIGASTSMAERSELVADAVLAKLASQVLIPVEKLRAMLGRPLAELGMDSIVSAELRAWLWAEVKVEVSFAELLEGGMTVAGMVELIWGRVVEGKGEEDRREGR